MKKVFVILLAVLLLTFAAVAVSAADETQHTGISHTWMTTRQVEYPAGSYYCEKLLEELPVTMEAWVYLPADTYAQLGGTILGNKPQKNTEAFTFSIEESGVPQLAFGHIDGEHVFKFTKAVIPSATWTHVAVVYGTGTDGKQVYCYINGELKDSSAASKWFVPGADTLSLPFGLAGDRQQVNFEGFRGILGDVTAYSDVRTPEEVGADAANGPDLADAGLLFHYDLSDAVYGTTVTDSGKNGYHMSYEKMWLTQEERDAIMAADEREYTYSIAFIPDIQIATRLYPSRLKPIYDFLIDNKESLNIQYAISLGDLTDTNTEKEWDTVSTQTNRLNGIVPYSLIRGNHDITKNDSALLYDQYFSVPGEYYYEHVKTNGGFYDESTTANTYLLFSVGQVDYVILNIDFALTEDVLAWASSVLEQYPDRRAIIVTHGYLRSNGKLLSTGTSGAPSSYVSEWLDANDLWDQLVSKYSNIDLVACGHIGVDHIIYSKAVGDNGNTVHQMLSNTQYVDRQIRGAGIITLMHFTEDGRYARVEHYSTANQMYFRESNYGVAMDFDETAAPPPKAETITRYCEHCKTEQTWEALTSDFAENNDKPNIMGGHYYLADDLTAYEKTVQSGNMVCLDLNGYTYTANKHLILEKGATLNIQGAEGQMRGCGSDNGDPGRTIWVKAGAVLNLYSGTLTGRESTFRSAGNGGVVAAYGTFNMYGGVVCDGISEGVGGCVFVDRAGCFNMYGGKIFGGTAATSGNCVYTRGKTLLAKDATIEHMTVVPKSGSTTTEDLLTIQGVYTGTLCLSFAKASEPGVVMGISDGADLTGANIYFASYDLLVKVVGNTLVTYLPHAADVIGEWDAVTSYDTLAEAMENIRDGQMLILHRSMEDAVTIDKNILLDLNGRKIDNTLTAADGVTVRVMDTTTADYRIADGVYGKVKAISGNVLPAEATESRDPYLKIQGSSYISFHAVGLNIHSMSLRPDAAGLYYQNYFAGDEMVAQQVTSFGVVMSVTGAPDASTMADPTHYTCYDGESFHTEATGSLLRGIIKETNGAHTNLRNSTMTVYGRAYAQFGEGEYLFGITRERCLKEQVVSANAQFETLDDGQKTGLAELYERFPKLLGSWDLDKVAAYIAGS